MIEAAIETEATSASPLFELRSRGLQLLLRWSTISNEAAFGTAYFILMAMAVTHGGAGGIHRWLVDAAPPVQCAK